MIHKQIVSKNIYDNVLNKGDIEDSFNRYSDNKLRFPKTGKDIKDKLQIILFTKTAKFSAVIEQLEYLHSIMPVTTEQCQGNNYCADEDNNYPPILQCSYPCDYTYYNDSNKEVVVFSNKPDQLVSSVQEANSYSEYNELVYKGRDLCKELDMAQRLYDNFKDDDVYQLDISQLKSLGF